MQTLHNPVRKNLKISFILFVIALVALIMGTVFIFLGVDAIDRKLYAPDENEHEHWYYSYDKSTGEYHLYDKKGEYKCYWYDEATDEYYWFDLDRHMYYTYDEATGVYQWYNEPAGEYVKVRVYNPDDHSDAFAIIGLVLMPTYCVLLFVSGLFNMFYCKGSLKQSKLSTAIMVVGCVLLLPVVGMIYVVAYVKYDNIYGAKGLKTINIKEGKTVYALTQIAEGGTEYKDRQGSVWQTQDNGLSFERVATVGQETGAHASEGATSNASSFETQMLRNTAKTRFKLGIVLKFGAFVSLAIGMIMWGVLYGLMFSCLGVAFMMLACVAFLVSGFCNLSYLKNSVETTKFSRALLIVDCVFLFPIITAAYVAMVIRKNNVLSANRIKKITINDGLLKFVLTQQEVGGATYTDQQGNVWETNNNGLTFDLVKVGEGTSEHRSIYSGQCAIQTETAKAKKKLKISFIMFVSSIVGIVMAVSMLGAAGSWGSDTFPKETAAAYGIGATLMSLSEIAFFVSGFLNLSYRSSVTKPNVISQVMFIAVCIIVFPFIVYFFFVGLFAAGKVNLKTVTVMGRDGKQYTLKQIEPNGNDYKDQNGDIWKTYDNGVTFERVTMRAKDEKGDEHVLNPTYDEFITKHYEDKDGGEWVSKDGGQTFDKLVTEATVTEGDKVYYLRAIQAGHTHFIDQNGDYWLTNDGGKTFTRK